MLTSLAEHLSKRIAVISLAFAIPLHLYVDPVSGLTVRVAAAVAHAGHRRNNRRNRAGRPCRSQRDGGAECFLHRNSDGPVWCVAADTARRPLAIAFTLALAD